jgi:hypothetical protein
MSYKPGPQYLNLSEYVLGEKCTNPSTNPDSKIENYGSFSISAAVRYPYNPSYYGLAPQPYLTGVS